MGGAPPRSAQYGSDDTPRRCHLQAGSSSMLPSVYTAVRSITNTYVYKYIDDVITIHRQRVVEGGR